ncbi:CRISPR-associated protein Csh1 [Desulfofundulus australicus DSM 11792]|uniref:CRISPR-associated protein Csh1 n=1 Tax=Desulfofundulus australicus DSM 11792 TaxID=1121425 RepID=A0A1M5BDP6_9FIRM|nr:TIGR02556 family CRISPR-associated protein [Desulfofundulus australicus]SHF40457.1 CRISPR-associated protein Csh1 [Desulfofundulus australicus DSM 11792]
MVCCFKKKKQEVIVLLEAVALVGRTLARDGDPIEDLVLPPPRPSRGDKQYLVGLNFLMAGTKRGLSADMVEIDPAVLSRYRWVGNNVGNRPQFFLTTDKLEYLAGPALPNLLAALQGMGRLETGFHRKIAFLVETYFSTLPDGTYVLDPGKIGLAERDFLQHAWDGSSGKPRERAKKVIQAAAGELKRHLLAELELKTPEVVLWSVLLDGEILAADPSYAEVVLQSKEGAAAKGSKKSLPGVCSVCGLKKNSVTFDLAGLDFLKYYITDKIGFASGVSEQGFTRTFLICADCLRALLLAEKYARQHLNLRAGPVNFLVLPSFLIEQEIGREELEGWAAKLQARVGALSSLSGWLESIGGRGGLEKELEDFLLELPYDNLALLNFLFYQKSQSEFRVLALVKDVAPSRITHLLRHSYRVATKGEALLGADRAWWLDLTRIYQLIPISEGRRGVEHKKLLYIYEALLDQRPVSYHFLVEQFVALAAIYHTGGFTGTNIHPPAPGYEELEMGHRMLQANLLLMFMREEQLLEGGMSLNGAPELEGLSGEMQDYLREMKYGEPATALFLLGYLMNQIGRRQAEAGYRQKPVLEKINYAGMPWGKVMQLTNIVFSQLRQYDILRYNEGLFATMKRLLDAHRKKWPLSPQENVFFILSGYAYASRAAIKAREENASENNASA